MSPSCYNRVYSGAHRQLTCDKNFYEGASFGGRTGPTLYHLNTKLKKSIFFPQQYPLFETHGCTHELITLKILQRITLQRCDQTLRGLVFCSMNTLKYFYAKHFHELSFKLRRVNCINRSNTSKTTFDILKKVLTTSFA